VCQEGPEAQAGQEAKEEGRRQEEEEVKS